MLPRRNTQISVRNVVVVEDVEVAETTTEKMAKEEVAVITEVRVAVVAVAVVVAVTAKSAQRDVAEVMVALNAEVHPTLIVNDRETQMSVQMVKLLSMELKLVDTVKVTKAKLAKNGIHRTSIPELAVEREMTADREPALDGVRKAKRSQKVKMVLKKLREKLETSTDQETIATGKLNAVIPGPKSLKRNQRKKLDSLLMTTKPRKRLLT